MATTHKLISSVTVGAGGAANIEFTSIPQTYTDLKLVLSTRVGSADYKPTSVVRFNGSSGANYNERMLYGDGAAASVLSNNNTSFIWVYSNGASSTANTFSNFELYIPNYTSSSNKSVSIDGVIEINSSSNFIDVLDAGLWAQTAAITSFSITPSSNSFVQYSTAYLYGIKNS